jgi:hypothetical protein
MVKEAPPQDDHDNPRTVNPGLRWWLKQSLLTGIACFFVYFGISLLVGAYRLQNPFSFIMAFFGASLMILISAVMVMCFVVRMWRVRARRRIRNPIGINRF